RSLAFSGRHPGRGAPGGNPSAWPRLPPSAVFAWYTLRSIRTPEYPIGRFAEYGNHISAVPPPRAPRRHVHGERDGDHLRALPNGRSEGPEPGRYDATGSGAGRAARGPELQAAPTALRRGRARRQSDRTGTGRRLSGAC